MRKPSVYVKTLSLVLSAGLVVSASTIATASPKPNFSSQGQKAPSETLVGNKRLRFKVRGVRASRRRTGGISRGSRMCYGEEITVTPLLPKLTPEQSSKPDKIAIESTVVPDPNFYVYVSPTKAQEASFTLLNEQGDEIIYEETIDLKDNNPGIISVSLPENANLLEENQTYHWFFSVQCDPNDSAGDAIVEGWVKRVPMDDQLESELEQAEDRDRPTVYAEYGIWTDSLTALVELRERYPTDQEVAGDWRSLLESVGLDTIADEPIIGSVTGIE
ncbi:MULTISPECIES: DUF928 domain-containing protein [unclassified Coleofasciculus]|uniref:DUF928 domain-containing protein n=1 Tax=unclassified Coleofasciculus TaxID=2692782 RepID=UPI0018815D93|nr:MULTISPECIES: DUF928 domain-containing protein [unclassified Coleofasciculus]MBE9127883.1 DUF928 domain-containing protein [Coleofasciculus sp. LEGE 07081]MBE9151075.1 DUF928 domain-containing protein [Coleofasciculus sp. LEGE 07092]